MIGHREGHQVVLCDACYRPKRTGEKGWAHRDEGGFPAGTASGDPERGRKVGRTVELPEQGLDYCPDEGCVQATIEGSRVRA